MASELAALSNELATAVERAGRRWLRCMPVRGFLRAGFSGGRASWSPPSIPSAARCCYSGVTVGFVLSTPEEPLPSKNKSHSCAGLQPNWREAGLKPARAKARPTQAGPKAQAVKTRYTPFRSRNASSISALAAGVGMLKGSRGGPP